MVLLSNIFNRSNHTKYVSLNNQKCMTQPALINLHTNEYSQDFRCYAFAVKLDRYFGSCNNLNNSSTYSSNPVITNGKTAWKHGQNVAEFWY